jgi:alpha-N-acetylglucosaminidase
MVVPCVSTLHYYKNICPESIDRRLKGPAMKILRKTLLLFLALVSFHTYAQQFTAVKELVKRRIPWLDSKISFAQIEKDNSADRFELTTANGKLYVSATGPNAACMGVNWYLKHYCHRSISHFGDNMGRVDKLPAIKGTVKKSCSFATRYALNYCTVSYTMPFYSWQDWERELDWMALNGYNLVLMPVGMEKVWQNTLQKAGFDKDEISRFIPGPAFTAWWLMGNLEGWGGPVPQALIDQQAETGRKIVARMRQLGIAPVIQGFYGMVPTCLKSKGYPAAVQGKWAGGFTRPDMLLPVDSCWKKLAGIYYTEITKLYGTDIRYFGGDPFHEGGKSKTVDVKHLAELMQGEAQKHFPNSTWVLQGWGNNPSDELLSGLNKKHTLVIELFGENTNNWETRKAYGGSPFVWANVSNFGEKNGLYGKLQRFANEVYRAENGPYHDYLTGIGVIPEGIRNNPIVYDFMSELAWSGNKVEAADWIKDYVWCRYGFRNEKLLQAWSLLLQTVYSSPDVPQEGPSESIFCARPGINLSSVSSWGTRKRNYDTALFRKAVALYIEAGQGVKQPAGTYQIDKIDLLRQLHANEADKIYSRMMQAIEQKNKKGFETAYDQFEKLLLQQDSLLSTNPFFSLSTWLNAARKFGSPTHSANLCEKNARTQITYWGPANAQTDLHDYAHKEWGGLLGTLYLQRWRAFKTSIIDQLDGKQSTPDYFEMEKQWADQK